MSYTIVSITNRAVSINGILIGSPSKVVDPTYSGDDLLIGLYAHYGVDPAVRSSSYHHPGEGRRKRRTSLIKRILGKE